MDAWGRLLTMMKKERALIRYLAATIVIILLDRLLIALIHNYMGLFSLFHYLSPPFFTLLTLVFLVFLLSYLLIFLITFYEVLNGKQRPMLYVITIGSAMAFILSVVHAVVTLYG